MRPVSLVAGGAGFLGSHLCDALLARGHEVYAVDSLITGSRANVPEDAQLVEREIGTRGFVPSLPLGPALRIVRYTHIWHLASPASPKAYAAHPIETLDAGGRATRVLLEEARMSGARFILASTSEIYGDPLVHPQPESYWGNVNTLGPRSCYDEAKRYAEAFTYSAAQAWGVDARIARIFNTYGPRMQPSDGRVIPNFIESALRGEPLTIYGDGRQTRSFTYVSDLIRGLLALGDLETEPIAETLGMPERSVYRPPVFNLGNPDEHMNMLRLAQLIVSETGSRSKIVFRPLPGDDPKERQPVIDLARALLRWEPTVPFEEGLRLTLAGWRGSAGAPTGAAPTSAADAAA